MKCMVSRCLQDATHEFEGVVKIKVCFDHAIKLTIRFGRKGIKSKIKELNK